MTRLKSLLRLGTASIVPQALGPARFGLVLAAALLTAVEPGPAVPAAAHTASGAAPYRVAVFTPTTEGNTYWPEVHGAMRAAGDALGLELEFHEFQVYDRFEKPEQGAQILRSEPVPDAAVFAAVFGQAQLLMDAAEEEGIPFFLNGPLFPRELEQLGGAPRERYSNWIGYFHEDEVQKGRVLAEALIAEALKHDGVADDGTVQVVGIGGDAGWFGSRLREEGLRQAVAAHPAARLQQTVPTLWTPAEGRAMTRRLLQRYPEVSVIWAASDQLALGAAEALRELEREPGESAFVGGLDLSLVGLEAVKDGTLTATVASTALVWTEVLVYLHDYLRGLDFADHVGTEIIFEPHLADRASAQLFAELPQLYDRIDYRVFSMYHNRNLERYDFSLERFRENSSAAQGAR